MWKSDVSMVLASLLEKVFELLRDPERNILFLWSQFSNWKNRKKKKKKQAQREVREWAWLCTHKALFILVNEFQGLSESQEIHGSFSVGGTCTSLR